MCKNSVNFHSALEKSEISNEIKIPVWVVNTGDFIFTQLGKKYPSILYTCSRHQMAQSVFYGLFYPCNCRGGVLSFSHTTLIGRQLPAPFYEQTKYQLKRIEPDSTVNCQRKSMEHTIKEKYIYIIFYYFVYIILNVFSLFSGIFWHMKK